jgi:uncharacterized RDD family membrane protein YckC
MSTTNPYAPPRATVQDLTDPEGTKAFAGRGARLLVSTLDGLIFSFLVYVPLVIGMRVSGQPIIVSTGLGSSGAHFNSAALLGSAGWLPLIGLLVWAWLTSVLVARNGQSIGKKIWGIKVVRSDGSRASLARIFLLRNLLNGVLAFLPLYALIDALLIFGDKRQCLHDKIADTIVIKA